MGVSTLSDKPIGVLLMPLTETALRNAKPKEKSYKLADERGLYIEAYPGVQAVPRNRGAFDASC